MAYEQSFGTEMPGLKTLFLKSDEDQEILIPEGSYLNAHFQPPRSWIPMGFQPRVVQIYGQTQRSDRLR